MWTSPTAWKMFRKWAFNPKYSGVRAGKWWEGKFRNTSARSRRVSCKISLNNFSVSFSSLSLRMKLSFCRALRLLCCKTQNRSRRQKLCNNSLLLFAKWVQLAKLVYWNLFIYLWSVYALIPPKIFLNWMSNNSWLFHSLLWNFSVFM